jgi:hypothetical protein
MKIRTVAVCLAAVGSLTLGGCGSLSSGTGSNPAATGAEKPASQEPGAETPAAPAYTVAQENAIESAQSYIDNGSFSEKGLLKQLTSEYGEGFKKADAVFAIKRINVDWNAEAREAAKSYLDNGSFSRKSLLKQLTSQYGEQFTQAQALQAVKAVGL